MHALVTGASSGIGRELARLLAADGHRLTLVARSGDQLEQLAAELGGADVVAADLATSAGVTQVVERVAEVDLLVNNAGYGDWGRFADSDLDKQLGMVDLNVRALTHLTHAYLPGMLGRGHGRVLNVASTAAFQPGPLMAVYYATKAYVLSFTEALAEEVRGSGVTVTALCPGPTASGFQSAAALEESRLVAGRTLPSAESVARKGYTGWMRGRAVVVTGLGNKVMAAAPRVTPRPVVRRLVARVQGSAHPPR